jgi:hypothetical protein
MIAVCCREELRLLEKIVKEIQPVNMEIQQYRIAIRQSQSDLVKNIEPVTVNNWLQNIEQHSGRCKRNSAEVPSSSIQFGISIYFE